MRGRNTGTKEPANPKAARMARHKARKSAVQRFFAFVYLGSYTQPRHLPGQRKDTRPPGERQDPMSR
ncbi:MAG: hypothetical protein BECKG1743D_GA0114223_106911 [Candidatus Kentron sp. G]|nr:MAG: hypothetical protein BECKG1743D_GA0114223_106911 [Candidatus Kentron sp. G]